MYCKKKKKKIQYTKKGIELIIPRAEKSWSGQERGIFLLSYGAFTLTVFLWGPHGKDNTIKNKQKQTKTNKNKKNVL